MIKIISISVVKSLDDLLQAWNRRLRNPVADYIILWLSAYASEDVYPYSIHAKLVEIWNDEEAPALQSIYSAIRRLEGEELLESKQEIVDGRIQKILRATQRGFDLIDMMQDAFEDVTRSLHNYEVNYDRN